MDQPLLEHTDALLEQVCRVMDAVEETGWSPPAVLGTLDAIEALVVVLVRLGPAVAQALEPVPAATEALRALVAASPPPTAEQVQRNRPPLRSASPGPVRAEDWLTRDGRVAEQLWSDQTRWPDTVETRLFAALPAAAKVEAVDIGPGPRPQDWLRLLEELTDRWANGRPAGPRSAP